MTETVYKSYDELPLFLDTKPLNMVLGISMSGTYELMHKAGFPSVRIGSRIVVPKKDFIEWIENRKGGK